MGEGGIDPNYFLRRMSWWEVQRFINGFRRRQRVGWQQTRWFAWTVARMLNVKEIDSPADMLQFPWEQEIVNKEKDEEDLQRLLAQCRAENKAAELGKP